MCARAVAAHAAEARAGKEMDGRTRLITMVQMIPYLSENTINEC